MGSSRLAGLVISEERALAGRLAGALYLVGAVTALGLLALPGVEVSEPEVMVALAAAGGAWAAACLTVVPWRTAHPLVSHLSSAAGFPVSAIAMAVSGGGHSPARFYLLFILVYTSYFYSRPVAIPYVAGCIATLVVPLSYGTGHAAYAAELVVVVPTYIVLGTLLIASKRVLVELRERADDLAHRDALTGLANRRALMERLGQLVASGRDEDMRFGFVLLDVDDFKSANTLFGHQAGDAVLEAAAAALQGQARSHDTVARLGGDEFAVVVRFGTPDTMASTTERLLEAVRGARIEGAAADMRITASAGWACHPNDAHTVEGLIGVADQAMRSAKAHGKDRSLAPSF